MNLRGRHRLEAYSPKSVEVGSYELRHNGVLGSSSMIMTGAPAIGTGTGRANNPSVMRSGYLK
jgi:hypothetical protein